MYMYIYCVYIYRHIYRHIYTYIYIYIYMYLRNKCLTSGTSFYAFRFMPHQFEPTDSDSTVCRRYHIHDIGSRYMSTMIMIRFGTQSRWNAWWVVEANKYYRQVLSSWRCAARVLNNMVEGQRANNETTTPRPIRTNAKL